VASFTVGGQRWADGTSVGAYLAAAWVNPPQAPSGVAVSTAVVASGSVTFTGLAERVAYVAYAAGVGVRFVVPRIDPTDTRSLRTRVDDLAVAGGQTSGGGVTANVFNGSTWPTRPSATVVHWIGGGPADDPFVVMNHGDVWFPSQGSV
jgi:hypothetical protein